jgi:alkyl hydroperoxide reductase subunit AhpC
MTANAAAPPVCHRRFAAALYNFVSVDNAARWGQFIIDAAGFVRHVEICRCRINANADDLVRLVRGIANDGIVNSRRKNDD